MKRLNHALLLNVTEMLRFMSQNAGADSTLAMSKVQSSPAQAKQSAHGRFGS